MRAPDVASGLSFKEFGRGPTVLLIHGGGFDMTAWEHVARELSPLHRVLIYNRRGYPGSGRPTADVRQHGRDAALLLASTRAAPATVVGHSFGAIVAVELAQTRPELVHGLVLLEPTLHARRALTPGALWAYLRLRLLLRLGRRSSAAAGFCRWMTSYGGGGSAWAAYPPERRRAFLHNAPGLFADLAAGDGRHLPRDIVSRLRCPVMVVMGEHTRRWFRRNADRIATAANACSLCVQAAGHDLLFDQPIEVAAVIDTATRRRT
jgi:pimeloyl-ACP methyl ester carboxylesterase